MNNSPKPTLSASEEAKQRVIKVYPFAHCYPQDYGAQQRFIVADSQNWDCGSIGKSTSADAAWIDAASRLPALSEDAIGSDICNHCDHMRCLHQDDNPDLGCDHHDNQGAPCGCTKFIPPFTDRPAEGIDNTPWMDYEDAGKEAYAEERVIVFRAKPTGQKFAAHPEGHYIALTLPVEPAEGIATETKTDVYEVYGSCATSRGWDFLVCPTLKGALEHTADSLDSLDEGEEVKIVFRRYTQNQMHEVAYE